MSVVLQGVGLTHANGFVALRNLDLEVRQGEQIALIGPSGAGKTSLLNLLCTALSATTGSVTLLGHRLPVPGTTLAPLRSRIGTIHQAPPIPARQRVVTAVLAGRLGRWPLWKSLSSLVYPADIDGARQALEQLALGDKLFARCDQLSGGQLQRVGIARVLYQEADLILADEPVSALDPSLALASLKTLTRAAAQRQATLVTSLHAVDLALRNFPRIIGIKEGGIAFDLPTEAVDEFRLHQLYAAEGETLPTLATDHSKVAPAPEATGSRPCC